LLTIEQSYVGVIATVIYLALMALVLVNLIKDVRDKRLLKNREELSKKPFLQFMAYSVLWMCLIVIMDPAGAFLYSTLSVPLLLLLVNWFINFNNVYQKALFYTALGAVALNNVMQVMKFRDALGYLY
jgi:hypothetical protein